MMIYLIWKGGKYINNKIKTTQEWIVLDKVLDDGIFISKNRYLKIIKVFPINYELKSDLEKESILNSFKLFLKTCDFDIQILIQSKRENFNSYISKIENQEKIEKNRKISDISNKFIEYIQEKNLILNSSFKNFYILISSQIENDNDFSVKAIKEDLKNKYLIIKDTLSKCGNFISDVDNRKEVERILYSFYNFRKSFNFYERRKD